MGKKKRIKHTVFGSVEGIREQAFINFLYEIYAPDENNINFQAKCTSGGTPDKIVTTALHECSRDKSFAWFDEDFEPSESPLSDEVRQQLVKWWNVIDEEQVRALRACPIGKLQAIYNPNNKKPILIVSQPVCSESLILRALDQEIPYETYDPKQRKSQIDGLKNKLDQLIGKKKPSEEEQTAYYRTNLTKEALEERRKSIPELDLLISMLTK